jgi:hypothetical protein
MPKARLLGVVDAARPPVAACRHFNITERTEITPNAAAQDCDMPTARADGARTTASGTRQEDPMIRKRMIQGDWLPPVHREGVRLDGDDHRPGNDRQPLAEVNEAWEYAMAT